MSRRVCSEPVLRLRGLPFDISTEKVRNFFLEDNFDTEDIVVLNQGFHRGEGFVKFKTLEDAQVALKDCDKKDLGDRYVELFPSTLQAFEEAFRDASNFSQDPGNMIRLRGLPFSASHNDVRDFFIVPTEQQQQQKSQKKPGAGGGNDEGEGDQSNNDEDSKKQIVSTNLTAGDIVEIILPLNGSGQPTGDAFVRFKCLASKQEAMKKHRNILGSRYVEIFDCSAGERDMAMKHAARQGAFGRGGSGGLDPTMIRTGVVSVGGGGAGTGGGRGLGGAAGRGGIHHQGYNPHHHQHHHHHHHHNNHHHQFNNNNTQGMNPSAQAMAAAVAMQHNYAQAAAFASAFGNQAPPPGVMLPPGHRSFPVIRVRGLPFSANETAVAEFLKGVRVPPQGVHMVYNANERPTGDAFVEVCTEQDVQAALRLHKANMGHRYVEVFQSSQADMYRLQTGMPPPSFSSQQHPNAGGMQQQHQQQMNNNNNMHHHHHQRRQLPQFNPTAAVATASAGGGGGGGNSYGQL